MQERQLFEYAVIRVVPRIEREEFINVGVILYCAQQRFLQTRYTVNEARLCSFCHLVDAQQIAARLQAFTLISSGDAAGGPIARLPIASRFRWLTAMRSTVVQTSRVHPGFCFDAADTLQKLYTELVE